MTGARAVEMSLAVNAKWTFGAVGDFDGNGRADILWRDTANTAQIWNGGSSESSTSLALPSSLTVVGARSIDGSKVEVIMATAKNHAGFTRMKLDRGVDVLVADSTWQLVSR